MTDRERIERAVEAALDKWEPRREYVEVLRGFGNRACREYARLLAEQPPEDALEVAREWVRKLRRNCHATYNGGHLDDAGALRAFHHGMDTVCNVLEDSLVAEPPFIDGDGRRRVTCPKCAGRGHPLSTETRPRKTEATICGKCMGTGKVPEPDDDLIRDARKVARGWLEVSRDTP